MGKGILPPFGVSLYLLLQVEGGARTVVYVISKGGQPLMPTGNHAKVRALLKAKKAKVVQRTPFTIQLTYETTCFTQEVTLGVDAGSKQIGLSATTETKELYAAEVTLRTDVTKLMDARRAFRRARRNRTTRYRKPRFCNRVRGKYKGWLAPTVEQKINTHLQVIKQIHRILPITSIVVETASFDIQLLKAQLSGKPLPEGVGYQQGELFNWNLREYVFHRDGYACQWCYGKSGSKALHTHHWNYWRGDHTNKPSSLITLCDKCNDSKNHKPEAKTLWGWEPKITVSFKDAAFMGIMRWTFYNRLKERYPNVSMTYGYITKNTRIANGLEKDHAVDARCISGHPSAVPARELYIQKAVRRHNRQIHKATIKKYGIRKLNQSPKYVFGYQLFDKVLYQGQEAFIFGRRASGSFDIRKLDGEKLNAGVSYKKLKPLERRKTILTEKEIRATSSPCLKTGVSVVCS